MKPVRRLIQEETYDSFSTVGKHNNIPDRLFNQNELKMGIEVEYEHTDSYLIAKAIAKDHLAECPDYYTRLINMEERCEREYPEYANT